MTNHENVLTLPPEVELQANFRSGHFRIGEPVADARYQIRELIPTEWPTDVYRVTDGEEEGEVALKIFHEPNEVARRYVNRELRTHLHLAGSPNVLSLRDMGILEKDNRHHRYIATEFAAWGTLDQAARSHPRDLDMLFSMAADILSALELVHNDGMVHNDVKPANIFHSDRWQLGDFGIVEPFGPSRLSDIPPDDLVSETQAEEATTSIGNITGSVGFIAPEKLNSCDAFTDPEVDLPNVGPEADVFSFGGVTLFYVATGGRYPFKSSGLEAYRMAVINESPVSAQTINSAVPLELDHLIMDCLEPNPANRPTTRELASSLQTI